MENSGTTFSQKKDNNYGRNVVIQNIKVDLQAMKDKKRLRIMKEMTKEELMSLIDKARKDIDQRLLVLKPNYKRRIQS